jgi:hypothetical protein
MPLSCRFVSTPGGLIEHDHRIELTSVVPVTTRANASDNVLAAQDFCRDGQEVSEHSAYMTAILSSS